MKNGYEYYYLLGLDLNLEDFGLGVIKQPRLIDFLNKDVSIEGFYTPFIMNDYVIGKSDNKEEMTTLKNHLGSLTFLIGLIGTDLGVVNQLITSLKFLYDTDSVIINEDYSINIDDILITNDNFNMLSDIVLEMQNLDKGQFKFENDNKKIDDPIEARFEFFRKKSKKKKTEVSMIDHLNYLIHSNEGSMDYEKILNMTMYQIRNSLGTLGHKVNYETMFKYKLSSKFDIKDNIKNWNFEKIVKNSSINCGV
ncbi:MAG: hypothetical protein ACRCX8_03775 [Sarcina sp.]